MNSKELKAQVEKLREALRKNETSLIDIFEYVAGYADTNPPTAAALLRHMQDVIQEGANDGVSDMEYGDILCDGIVRTFIASEFRNRYPGVDQIEDPGTALSFLGDLTDHVIALQNPQVLATANAPTHVAH